MGQAASAPSAAGRLRPRSKVWLERDGRVVLSEWRVQLLEAVAMTGSLAGAAAQIGVPYRTAWTRLREIEAGLGFKVLDTQVGGVEGGSSALTAQARRVLDRFHRVADGVGRLVDERFAEEFGIGDDA